jgi:hypothetical protein
MIDTELHSEAARLNDTSVMCRIQRTPPQPHSTATRHEFVTWLLVDEDNVKHRAAVGVGKVSGGALLFRPVQMGAQLCSMFPDAVRPSFRHTLKLHA